MRMAVLAPFLFVAATGSVVADDELVPVNGNADVATLVDANNQFAFELFRAISARQGVEEANFSNILFSPASISTAMAMTFSGARGSTESQMAQVMHFDVVPPERLHRAFGDLIYELNTRKSQRLELVLAQRLWGQEGYRFLPQFLQANRDCYGAELGLVDFRHGREDARRTINTWVRKQTRDRIQEVLDRYSLSELTRLVLTQAITFKGNWVSQFESRQTRDAVFTTASGKAVTMAMMTQEARFRYGSFADFQYLEMPFDGGLSFVVLLPKQLGGLQRLERSLDFETFEKLRAGAAKTNVLVYLPRFKVSERIQLARILASAGMPLAFHPSADFSGMTGRQELYLSEVVHVANASFDELGGEASAATAVVALASSVQPPTPVVRCDRSFVYCIVDDRTGSILFLGRLAEPAT